MRHAERAMQSSLEAANNHGTSLQHRLAQVMAESSRLHQMLFDTQQCLEGVKSTLTVKLAEAEEQSKKAIAIKKQVNIFYNKSLNLITNLLNSRSNLKYNNHVYRKSTV